MLQHRPYLHRRILNILPYLTFEHFFEGQTMKHNISPFLSQKFRFWSFISMVLLVFVHAYNLDQRYLQPFTLVGEPLTFTTFFEYFTANGIFRFRIPMLFAISGFLFALGDTQAHGERVQSRLRTLLVPYLFWSAFGLALTWCLEQFTQTQGFVRSADLSQPIAAYQVQDWLMRWLLEPVPFQLWFIRVLLVYNLAYPLIARVVTSSPKIWFGIILIIWLIFPVSLGFLEPEGLLFFSLGVWMQKTNFDIEQLPKRVNISLVAVLCIAVAAGKTLASFMIPEQSLRHPAAFMGLLVWHRLIEGLGLYVAWYGMDALVRGAMARQWFRWASAFSFMIYALHVPLVNYLLAPTFEILHGLPMFRLTAYFLLPITLILFCISVGALLRRFAPPVYEIVTGGRGMNSK